MRNFFGAIFAIFWKDIRLEFRSKEIVLAILVFSLLTIVIFNFALEPTSETIGFIAPGILWISFIFGGVLGLNRSFAIENINNNFQGILLAPISRDSFFFGKMIANFVFMLLVEALVLPIFAVLFNISFPILNLVLINILATLGIVTVGTLFSFIAVNSRAREVMLPVLLLPVSVPIIVGAVQSTGVIFQGGELSEIFVWLTFLAAFDAIFLVVCPIAFHLAVEE